jgi:hypothetical protein
MLRKRTELRGMLEQNKYALNDHRMATDPEVPGSIPGPTRFSEK